MTIEADNQCTPPKGRFIGGQVAYSYRYVEFTLEYSPVSAEATPPSPNNSYPCIKEQIRTDPEVQERVKKSRGSVPCYRCNRKVSCLSFKYQRNSALPRPKNQP